MLSITVLILFISFCTALLQQPCYYSNQELPIPVYNHQMVYFTSTNTVYLFGGIKQTENGKFPNTNIYKWNLSAPSNSSWFQLISTKTPTQQFWSNISNVVTIENTAYFIGVYDNYFYGNIYTFNAKTELFNDINNLSKSIYPSIFGCLSTNNTHIFMVGGQVINNNQFEFINVLQIYDIKKDQWFAQNISIFNKYNQGLNGWGHQFCPNKLINGQLFVFGGFAGVNYKCCNEGYMYEWFNTFNGYDGWYYLENIATNNMLYDGSSVYDEYNSRIYLIGGKNGTHQNSSSNGIYSFKEINGVLAHVYHIVDSISSTSSLIIFSGTKLFTFGGIGNDNVVSKSVQICDINI